MGAHQGSAVGQSSGRGGTARDHHPFEEAVLWAASENRAPGVICRISMTTGIASTPLWSMVMQGCLVETDDVE